MTDAMKKSMGEPFVSVMARYDISIAEGLRFMAVSGHPVNGREARGLTFHGTEARSTTSRGENGQLLPGSGILQDEIRAGGEDRNEATDEGVDP